MTDTPNRETLRERLTGEYARAVRQGDVCNVRREDMADILEDWAARVQAEEALEAAQKACNICGRPWPNHYENCAYPKNVDRAVRAEEALRQIVDIPNTPLSRRESGWNYATFRNYALHLAEKALAVFPEENKQKTMQIVRDFCYYCQTQPGFPHRIQCPVVLKEADKMAETQHGPSEYDELLRKHKELEEDAHRLRRKCEQLSFDYTKKYKNLEEDYNTVVMLNEQHRQKVVELEEQLGFLRKIIHLADSYPKGGSISENS